MNNTNLYTVIDTSVKNKHTELYYKKAIEKEIKRLLTTVIKDIENNYTTFYVNNYLPDSSDLNKTSSIKKLTILTSLIDKYKGKYLNVFIFNTEKIVKKWWKLLSFHSRTAIKKAFKAKLSSNIAMQYTQASDKLFRLAVKSNVNLIKGVATDTLNNIEQIIYRGTTTGQSLLSVKKQLLEETDLTVKRVKLIARDQTAKANASLNEILQREADVKFFMWRTSHDERVSTGKGGHKQLDGKIYKWGDVDNYPEIDKYGNKGTPHQRINCRCEALAVVLLDDYEARQLPDGSYEILKGGELNNIKSKHLHKTDKE